MRLIDLDFITETLDVPYGEKRMKAILITDMPKSCEECQFCGRGGRNLERYVCSLTREHSEDIHLVGCPLKPMPEKYLERDITIETERDVEMCTHGITIGRNVLIDEILGEIE